MLGSPIGAASRRVQTRTNYRASKPTATAVRTAIFTKWRGFRVSEFSVLIESEFRRYWKKIRANSYEAADFIARQWLEPGERIVTIQKRRFQ